jgi:hypothetical protein
VRTVETILRSIEANAEEFKRLCEVKACSPTLLEDLDKALSEGAQLSVNIETVMSLLLDLKTRLESK